MDFIVNSITGLGAGVIGLGIAVAWDRLVTYKNWRGWNLG